MTAEPTADEINRAIAEFAEDEVYCMECGRINSPGPHVDRWGNACNGDPGPTDYMSSLDAQIPALLSLGKRGYNYNLWLEDDGVIAAHIWKQSDEDCEHVENGATPAEASARALYAVIREGQQ